MDGHAPTLAHGRLIYLLFIYLFWPGQWFKLREGVVEIPSWVFHTRTEVSGLSGETQGLAARPLLPRNHGWQERNSGPPNPSSVGGALEPEPEVPTHWSPPERQLALYLPPVCLTCWVSVVAPG